jgi:transposase
MTKQTRRKFSADFKAKVALEAIKNEKTLAQLSQQFEVNAITISKWKAEFLERMSLIFEREGSVQNEAGESPELDKLYAQIGQLKVENDFLKKSAKKLGIPQSEWKP